MKLTLLCLLLSCTFTLGQVELDIGPRSDEGIPGSATNTPFFNQAPTQAATNGAIAPPPSAQLALTNSPKVNLYSMTGEPVFGAHLFQGSFRDISFTGFNPNYQISIGDKIQLMLWGATQTQITLTVDPQGNIFIPEVGPVKVSGARNADLQQLISDRIQNVFKDTVQSYSVLATAQPVKVFVTGAVNRPGLYGGYSSDSVLYFLDKAYGIDLDEGSFIDIEVIRSNNTIDKVDLYDFLVNGNMKLLQFSDGDRIVVKPLRYTISFEGAVRNAYRFEFPNRDIPLTQALQLAQPDPTATHLSVTSRSGGHSKAAYYALNETDGLMLSPGDVVNVTRQIRPDSILINIQGEHEGANHQVHMYGATLADAIARIRPTALSNMDSLQLFRTSVADRQKQRIEESLDNLERNMLSARSDSLEEAKIRSEEAKLITQFIERARNAQPKGHVILGDRPGESQVVLEDGDTIFIPAKSNLVAVHGQVIYPTTQVWSKDMSIRDYVSLSGGFTEQADKDRILLVKTNGVVVNLDEIGENYKHFDPEPGEEIIVLPEPDTKTLQFAKDISTILYQIAIATRVAVGI